MGSANEATHSFCAPALLHGDGDSLGHQLAVWGAFIQQVEGSVHRNQQSVDEIAYHVYGIADEDRLVIEGSAGVPASTLPKPNSDAEGGEDEEHESVGAAADVRGLAADMLSYTMGCVFGRWDVRVGCDPTLAPTLQDSFDPLPVCSPGMLVGLDGLPATPGGIVGEEWLRARPNAITLPPEGSVMQPTISDEEYPLRVTWDGILVDDADHPQDIMRRVQEVLAVLWKERAEAIEQEACEILGVKELREYVRRPGSFFAGHLKRYSKSRRQAPIYWPLSTASGSYTVWIYYHRLTSDTLYTAVNRFVGPKIAAVQRDLNELDLRLQDAFGREASRLREQAEGAGAFLAELRDFSAELLRVAALPYRPNLDDGVIVNAAPLHRLFRLPGRAKNTRECWAKLEQGDFDWAHLAYTLWPERVHEKCTADRSLAIAHDLEELYVAPPAPTLGRGRRRGAAAPVLMEEGE